MQVGCTFNENPSVIDRNKLTEELTNWLRFLLAQLHMDSLASKNTTKAVRKALETMPTTLDATYEEAVSRIGDQTEEDKDLALRVLAWVSYAFRRLTVKELRQALAVEPEESELDDENMPDQDTLLSVCAGLVASDHASGVIRLVHFTAQDWFIRHRQSLFPTAITDISLTCLAYLSFETFSEVCHSDEELGKRLGTMPFYLYAARYWGEHARDDVDPTLHKSILDFLDQTSGMMSSVQTQYIPEYLYSGYSQGYPRGVSKLWLAASFGLVRTIQTLLGDASLDINIRDDTYGWSALFKASESGHEKAVQLLLLKGTDAQLPDFRFGRTPLYQAAINGHIDVARLLTDNGADIEIQDKEGKTALHGAAASGQKDMVLMLIANGADLEARDKADWTPLHRAAGSGRLAVTDALLQSGAIVDETMRGGWTALAKAARHGHPLVVSLLIKHGANVNNRDKDRSTPLHMSIWDGHGPVATLLIDHGADLEAHDQDGWTPLHDAAWRGSLAMVRLLLDKGADIAAVSNEGWTALHRATFGGGSEAAELLVQRGADPEARDIYGETPLLQASWSGHEKLVSVLLAAKAEVDAQANDGETALHRAAANGHLNVTASLLIAGANPDAKNNKGETAMDQASEYHETEVVKMLTQWKTTHQMANSTNPSPTTSALVKTNPMACMADIDIEKEYETVDKQQPEEQSSETIDPAILAAIPLNLTLTTIAPYGPPGFSMKARISTILGGAKRRYFIKTYLKGNETSVFEGKPIITFPEA